MKQDEEGEELDQDQKLQLVRAQLEELEAQQKREVQIMREMEENPALKEYLDNKQEELTTLILQGDVAEAAKEMELSLWHINEIRCSSDGEKEARARARWKVLEEYSKELKQMESLDDLFWSSPKKD